MTSIPARMPTTVSPPLRADQTVCIQRDPASTPDQLTPADAVWPARFRRITRAVLNNWGYPDLVETAELLVTELATNALQHGAGSHVKFRLRLHDDRLLIEVNDGSPTVRVPRCPRRPSLYDENGRGLILVEALAETWGVSEDGTTTWCTLPLAKDPRWNLLR